MKKFLLGSLVAIALFSCGGSKTETATNVDSTVSAPVTYTIDTATSTVAWKGEMLKMYSHYGLIKLNEGSLTVDKGAITAGSFVVNMKTISPLDSSYDNKKNTKANFIGHMGSADFFASDSFATASFTIKKVEGNTITGDLTVRGKTNEEKVTDVVVASDSASVTATGKLVFNRQKYGVAYSTGKKDFLISDDIQLSISLSGKK